MILLHGGPGPSETDLFRYYEAALEKSSTVVYWDQRGAGKSIDRSIPRSSMTVEQFLSDLDELVAAVCARVAAAKVALFGHSWGSALGVLYAARFPEKAAAYVGGGQIGDAAVGESVSYNHALTEAQRLGRRRLLKMLRAIGPPPYGAAEIFAQQAILARLEGERKAESLHRGTRNSRSEDSALASAARPICQSALGRMP